MYNNELINEIQKKCISDTVVLASKNYPLLAHLPFRNRLISYLLKNSSFPARKLTKFGGEFAEIGL